MLMTTTKPTWIVVTQFNSNGLGRIPAFFSTDSKTARAIAAKYAETHIEALLPHPLEANTKPNQAEEQNLKCNGQNLNTYSRYTWMVLSQQCKKKQRRNIPTSPMCSPACHSWHLPTQPLVSRKGKGNGRPSKRYWDGLWIEKIKKCSKRNPKSTKLFKQCKKCCATKKECHSETSKNSWRNYTMQQQESHKEKAWWLH